MDNTIKEKKKLFHKIKRKKIENKLLRCTLNNLDPSSDIKANGRELCCNQENVYFKKNTFRTPHYIDPIRYTIANTQGNLGAPVQPGKVEHW